MNRVSISRAKPEWVGESGTECFIPTSVTEDGNHISASISSTGPKREHSSELEKGRAL